MEARPKKQISVRLKHPNPLFEKWLNEWKNKSAENNSKMQHCFAKALHSLKLYPLPLQTGKDCKILNGFGDKLCNMLDDKLRNYNENKTDLDVVISKSSSKGSTIKLKEYCPVYKSGAYAILVTLYKKSLDVDHKGFMTKNEIVTEGKHLCDISFVKPNPGTFYTAWSSMKTLIEKNLVLKQGKPQTFSLTDDGKIVARKSYELYVENQNEDKETNDKIEEKLQKDNRINCSEDVKNVNVAESIIFLPNTFDVLLYVDTAETSGKHSKEDPILSELEHLDVQFEVKHLKIGDYVWICRSRTTKEELVLPYVVERKRMDDFGQSIKDGRYHEQKFRLKQCGIENVIYMIESYGDNMHTGLPLSTLHQAEINTLIHDGFQVKRTDGLRGTALYLCLMTKILRSKFEVKTIIGCPKVNLEKFSINDDLVSALTFKEFNQSGSKYKNFTVREMFIRHLLQLKGVSVDKAFGIVERYPTPKLLKMAYDECIESDGEKLLAKVPFGPNGKNIGPIISKTLYQLYMLDQFK